MQNVGPPLPLLLAEDREGTADAVERLHHDLVDEVDRRIALLGERLVCEREPDAG